MPKTTTSISIARLEEEKSVVTFYTASTTRNLTREKCAHCLQEEHLGGCRLRCAAHSE